MAIEVFSRYEHKYIIDKKTFEKVVDVLNEYMDADAYNEGVLPYTISNIYYDTPNDYLIRRALSKPQYKEKLRLRSYGIPNKESDVYIEIKKKFDGIVNKRRSNLKLFEAYEFLKTGKIPEYRDYMNPQVLREVEYLLKIYDLSPKVYLAYDRIAYFEKNNNDLRISFDMNIRSRRKDLFFESGDYGEKLLLDGYYLMEIKTSLAKPLWLTNMLTEFDIKRTSFSKYGTEFKNMISHKEKDEIKYKEVI